MKIGGVGQEEDSCDKIESSEGIREEEQVTLMIRWDSGNLRRKKCLGSRKNSE